MPPALGEALSEARDLGFLGPGPVEAHIRHAESYVAAIGAAPALALDLGSGGGVPGLVLALRWPSSEWVLLDASERRTAFLEHAVHVLGLGDRVTVLRTRAEEAGRGPLRGTIDVVVARSFGPPAVTAECAAPLLRLGGRLVVSEPPERDDTRWPAAGTALLGLTGVPSAAPSVSVHRLDSPCPDRFPRRTGTPGKRPLF